MNPGQLSIKDFHYDLPNDKIAVYPLPERDQSKVLIYNNHQISEDIYANIAGYVPSQSLLFFNNTRVIPARLFFRTGTGQLIELFCLEPAETKTDLSQALLTTHRVLWKCMIGRASKWKEKDIFLNTPEIKLKATIVQKLHDSFIIELSWEPAHKTFLEILEIAGAIPIPPYLKRDTEELDLVRYQTIYAQKEGSVAAPTAGLHFTDRILKQLQTNAVSTHHITLHVGAGTFKPVKSERMQDHEMHAECLEVNYETIRTLKDNLNKNIAAVGTTATRTLESLYWLGLNAKLFPETLPDQFFVNQWMPYENKQEISAEESLDYLLAYMDAHQLRQLFSKTSLLIAPGYKFRIVKSLFTNFHQPESTLILLVAAFVGEDWRRIYNYALNNNFRFLSYGDGSLLFRAED